MKEEINVNSMKKSPMTAAEFQNLRDMMAVLKESNDIRQALYKTALALRDANRYLSQSSHAGLCFLENNHVQHVLLAGGNGHKAKLTCRNDPTNFMIVDMVLSEPGENAYTAECHTPSDHFSVWRDSWIIEDYE